MKNKDRKIEHIISPIILMGLHKPMIFINQLHRQMVLTKDAGPVSMGMILVSITPDMVLKWEF